MTSRSRAFQVKIIGDVADANKALQSMDQKVSKFSKAMGILSKGMSAAFAVKQVYDFGKAMVERADEMGSLYAVTNQILEQTGGVAGRTGDEIKEMNRHLAFTTGIDKALITAGSNVLLTFKGIRDEVGAGNDIWTRANGIMLDMATVFGGDAKSAATQLGKALEDPIKGISALTRVGVTFTDQQKDQIEAMVAAGDMLGAQKMILEALEGQVGGTAVAAADGTAKITQAWKEVQEWIGNIILPLFEKLAEWLIDVGIPAFERFATWISEMWGRITSIFKGGTGEQLDTVKGWVGKIVEYYTALKDMVLAIIERFVAIATWVWKNYGEQITAVMKVAWSNVKAIIDLILGVVINLVKLVTAIFKGDWSAAWSAAKGIVMAFWDFFKGIPGRMVDALRAAVGLVGKAAMDLGRAIVNGVIGFWNRLDPRITIGPMPTWLPGIGGKKWQSPDLLPDLPQLATGGIVTSPTIAMIGEAGPEAVIPLGNRFGSNSYQITVNVAPGGDLAETGRKVVEAIVAHERYAGDSWRRAAIAR